MREWKTHYDVIPSRYFVGNILDVGSRDGENQRKSSKWSLIECAIKTDRYTTIDIDASEFVTHHGDLFDIGPQLMRQHVVFDNVLAIHILEHIIRERWEEAFAILKGLVAPYGTLVIGTPYIEVPPMIGVTGPEHLKHKVYWIDCRDIVKLLDDTCTFRIYRGPYSMALMCYWTNAPV